MTKKMRFWQAMLPPLVLLSGCTVPQDFESDRPLRYIGELKVNTKNDLRYCAQMSEERGVKALRRLAETAEFEESWVYVPKIKQWEELGMNEGREIVDENDPRYRKRGVDLDGPFLNAVARKYREMIIYHIHNVKKRTISNTVFYNPECSLPSYDDLCIDLKVLNFYSEMNQGHSIRFKSVSLLGVTEVTFTKYAKDHYKELMGEGETVRSELSRLEGFNFLQSFRASVFRGSIEIDYHPLVKPK